MRGRAGQGRRGPRARPRGCSRRFVVRDASRLVGRAFPGFLVWDNGTLVALHTAEWSGAPGGPAAERRAHPRGRRRALRRRARALRRRGRGRRRPRPRATAFASGGEERSYRVAAMRMGWGDWLATFGNYLFNSLFFFAIALLALYLRPDLAAARALAASMLLIGLLMVLAIDFVGALAPGAPLPARRGGDARGLRVPRPGVPRRAPRRALAAPR